ncbi:hypothetical protein MCEMZLE12_01045 [actinobacterium SCGC AAA044-D11]
MEDLLAMKDTARRADLLYVRSIKGWFVMSGIEKQYVSVSVSEELLVRLKRDQDKAVGMAKYGRFKAWLHYANLQSWQNQGLHFRYVNNEGKEHWCTCGLIVPIGSDGDVKGLDDLELDDVHVAFGHRKLPSLKGITKALIYDSTWVEGSKDRHFNHGTYYYSAMCQVCLKHVKDLPGVDADAFVAAHENCEGGNVSG